MKSFGAAALALVYGAASVMAVSQVGCYKSSTGMTLGDTDDFQSMGHCAGVCKGSAVFATQLKKCYCGTKLPADSDKTDASQCSSPCPGYPDDNCGSASLFFYYSTASTTSAPAGGSTSSATSESSTPSSVVSAKPSVVTIQGQTVTATASSTPSSASQSSGPNKAGIAAGVVVGIIAIAGIAGGAFLFLRNRKRRAIEEEHRRNAAVSSFVGAGKTPASSGGGSFTDTRLDPVMSQRRMSDGSIADNQDYSRRILKVTNA